MISLSLSSKALPENQRTVPIGKPLANLNLYILDGQMQLLPIGVPGELCIRIWSRWGYWKNEERTQLSFVPVSSTATLPGTNRDLITNRRFRQVAADGNIEFLGRIDHKWRFAASASNLEKWGGVESALLRAGNRGSGSKDELGNQRLVAYVVANKPPPSVNCVAFARSYPTTCCLLPWCCWSNSSGCLTVR